MWPVIIRVAAAAVRIIPATVIVGALGYIGLDWVAKNWMPDVEKGNFDYDIHEEAMRNVQAEKERRGLQ